MAEHPQLIDIAIRDGCVLVGSDAHIWPGQGKSTAQRAFAYFIPELKPAVICLNGDVIDGARLSRFPVPGWEVQPDPAEEIEAAKTILADFSGPRRQIWTLGNHDWRFERYIANHAPHLKGLGAVSLKHHFPDWEPAWRLRVNKEVNIKHRSPGGTPLARVQKAGQTIITGHLHSMNVVRWSSYAGDHFAVDTGTLARVPGELHVPQFTHYTEDNPVDWAAGFVALTWHKGRLLWPELVHVIDEEKGLISFRGEVFNV